jgi:hypothetical protein
VISTVVTTSKITFPLFYVLFVDAVNSGGKKVKQFLYRPGQALRIPGGYGFQISRQSEHEGGTVVSPMHRPPLPPRKYSC